MIAADQLHQCDVRLRAAKSGRPFPFGGMAVNLCGDFLQLPPVDKSGSRKSLAINMDEYGRSTEPCVDADEGHDAAQTDGQKVQNLFESRRGHDLWRSVHRVVCLSVNIRAPGLLSTLLAEMRSGRISDKLWSLYEQRVMGPDDHRLREEPFASSQPVVIVHRHKIRAMRSLETAKRYCRERNVPLFLVQARDDAVHDSERPLFTKALREEVLKFVNPEKNRGLSSFLPLHVGMKLILSSKECVRLGLVKGCVCTLRSIVFADRECLPVDQEAGVPHKLSYMPATLFLQADGAKWTLTGCDLPKDLKQKTKREERLGLFQLANTTEYLRVKSGETYIHVKRTTFPVLPADTITVYAAQGGTYRAVIADMAKPPTMASHIHWLACYVMLSRATSLEGLLVLRPATRAELSAGGPPWLLAELDRLEQLERESHEELVKYLESFPDSVIPRTIKDLLSEDAPRREAMRVAEVRAGSAPQQSSQQSGVSVRPPHSVAPTSQTRDRPAAPELAAAGTAPAGQSRKRLHQKTPDSNAPQNKQPRFQNPLGESMSSAASSSGAPDATVLHRCSKSDRFGCSPKTSMLFLHAFQACA